MKNSPQLFRLHSGITAGTITVYGSMDCGWTKKQLEHLKNKGLDHHFVDCSSGQCPAFVQAFPTLDIDGKISAGYQRL